MDALYVRYLIACRWGAPQDGLCRSPMQVCTTIIYRSGTTHHRPTDRSAAFPFCSMLHDGCFFSQSQPMLRHYVTNCRQQGPHLVDLPLLPLLFTPVASGLSMGEPVTVTASSAMPGELGTAPVLRPALQMFHATASWAFGAAADGAPLPCCTSRRCEMVPAENWQDAVERCRGGFLGTKILLQF
jgi:hypothetical protein